MPLTLTSKTYPVAPGAVVVSLLPNGGNGFIGLTALDAATVLNDPANHFYADASVPVVTDPGETIVALAFSEDGGKTYQALPLLIRTPTTDPTYPFGLPVSGRYVLPAGATNYVTVPATLAYYFICGNSATNVLPLAAFSLVRDPQSGNPVFFGGVDNGGTGYAEIYQWTAQGDGTKAEHWVTTRPIMNPTLSAAGEIVGYRFFPYSIYSSSVNNRSVYPDIAFAGSPGIAFGGAKSFYFNAPAQAANREGYTPPTQGTSVNTNLNWPFAALGQNESQYGGLIVQPVAQHPHNANYLLRGSPAYQLAQSFDRGANVTKLYMTPAGLSLTQEADIFIPPLNRWPLNAHVFFVEDAIYAFGAWGYSVSRDGGQTWPGETINGVVYSFNLLHAKGGGYFPDQAVLSGDLGRGGSGTLGLLSPPWAFDPIRDDSSARNVIVRNSPPAAANPGGRVNSRQQTGLNNMAGLSQLTFTQTAHFGGSFWHAVAFGLQASPRWILLVSHDLGATWEQLPEPPQIAYQMHLVADPRTGWLHWGLQYYSRDGGQTWIASF